MASQQVVHTTLSARAVAEFTARVFEFSTPPTVRLASRGFNDVYEVVEPQRLFLRVGRQALRTLLHSELEARALAAARAGGATVVVARLGRGGRFAQRLPALAGGRRCSSLRREPMPDTPAHAYAPGPRAGTSA